MMLKLAILLGALALAWALLSRAGAGRSGGGAGKAARKPVSQDLVQCRACGIYLPPGTPCNCRDQA